MHQFPPLELEYRDSIWFDHIKDLSISLIISLSLFTSVYISTALRKALLSMLSHATVLTSRALFNCISTEGFTQEDFLSPSYPLHLPSSPDRV